MADMDALKLARDGHLAYGPWELSEEGYRERFRPPPGSMIWRIIRDEDGLPVRMEWCGRVPEEEPDA